MKKLPVEYLERKRRWALFRNDCGITDVIRGGGVYESYLFDYIRNNLHVEGTTILDIGANLGQHALEFADLVGENGIVHAYEAQRVVFMQLCANIFLNGYTNIYPHHVALSDYAWVTHVCTPDYFSDTTINVGNAFIAPELPHLHTRDLVDMKRLDDMGFENPPISVIKLDVEGAEPMVLDGARKIIEMYKPT